MKTIFTVNEFAEFFKVKNYKIYNANKKGIIFNYKKKYEGRLLFDMVNIYKYADHAGRKDEYIPKCLCHNEKDTKPLPFCYLMKKLDDYGLEHLHNLFMGMDMALSENIYQFVVGDEEDKYIINKDNSFPCQRSVPFYKTELINVYRKSDMKNHKTPYYTVGVMDISPHFLSMISSEMGSIYDNDKTHNYVLYNDYVKHQKNRDQAPYLDIRLSINYYFEEFLYKAYRLFYNYGKITTDTFYTRMLSACSPEAIRDVLDYVLEAMITAASYVTGGTHNSCSWETANCLKYVIRYIDDIYLNFKTQDSIYNVCVDFNNKNIFNIYKRTFRTDSIKEHSKMMEMLKFKK